MKVFIVTEYMSYEDTEIKGVFSSVSKAKEKLAELVALDNMCMENDKCILAHDGMSAGGIRVSLSVEEWEVQ